MINRDEIGNTIKITDNESTNKRKFFLVEDDNTISGYSVNNGVITFLEIDDIEVYPDTGLFLDHTGIRCFFIKPNRYLREFLPLTETFINPTDYDDIRIEDGDIPLMLLSDHSMLTTNVNKRFLRRITETERDPSLPFTVDGVQVENIKTLNFVDDRGAVHYSDNEGIQGKMEFNGVIPSNLISDTQRELPDISPVVIYKQWVFNSISENRVVSSMYGEDQYDNKFIQFYVYNNFQGNQDLIYITALIGTSESNLNFNSIHTCIIMIEFPFISMIGILKSIEYEYPGKKFLTIECLENLDDDSLYFLSETNTKKIFLNDEKDTLYHIESIHEVDKTKSVITIKRT